MQVERDICRAFREFRRDFFKLLRKHSSNFPSKSVEHKEEHRQLGYNLQNMDKGRFWERHQEEFNKIKKVSTDADREYRERDRERNLGSYN